MVKTPPTKQQIMDRDWTRTRDAVQSAFSDPYNVFSRGGAGLPTAFAFMGLPNMAARSAYGYGGGGGMGGMGGFSFDSFDSAGRGGHGGHGGGGNGGGGNDPGTDPGVDPAHLGSLGKVGGFPQWYIDWFNSQGKYGGVPQVSGLLNG